MRSKKRKEYQKAYRQGNVKMMLQQEEWLQLHPDYHKKWRKRNPKYYLYWRRKNPEYFKTWLENNADHRRTYMTDYMRKYRASLKDPSAPLPLSADTGADPERPTEPD